MTADLSEKHESLWSLAVPPAIWGAHFLLSYGSAALWCAKLAGRGGSASGARLAIALYTLAALAGVGAAACRARRRWRIADPTAAAADPTAAEADPRSHRRRFLGVATLLLSWLSAVAILYAALPALLIGRC
jgi:hypothetical protein